MSNIPWTIDSELEGIIQGVGLRNQIRAGIKRVLGNELEFIRIKGNNEAHRKGVTPDWIRANGWLFTMDPRNGDLLIGHPFRWHEYFTLPGGHN